MKSKILSTFNHYFFDDSRLNQIDFFRGVAITIVIIGHILIYYNWDFKFRPIDASFGVFIFFIISGYLITKNLVEKKYQTTINFILKRIFRIIPLAWFFLIITKKFNFFNATFTSNFMDQDYIGHFWSLKIELLFYLLIPFLLRFKQSNFLFMGYVILSPIFVYLDFHTELKYLEFGYIFNMLFLGSLAYSYREKIIKVKLNKTILIVLSIFICSFKFLPALLNELFSVIVFVVYFIKVLDYTKLSPPITRKPFVSFIFIGRISFSLYVFQQIFTLYPPIKIENHIVLSIVLNLLLLLIISLFSFILIENILFKKTLKLLKLK